MKTLQLQFDTGTWLKDPALSMCHPSTRGVWMDMLCAMHEANRCGQIVGTYAELAQLCRCTEATVTAAIHELKAKRAADITEFISEENSGSNAIVTVTNRRMRRDFEIRELGAKRSQKFRDNNRNLPTTHEAKRVAVMFRRQLTTPWDEKEIAAFRAIGKIEHDDLTALELFYKLAKNDDKAYLRTGLSAFLNNFRSETDKARAWLARHPKAAGNRNGNHPPETEPEPEGWRERKARLYPQSSPRMKWHEIPADIRKVLTDQTA